MRIGNRSDLEELCKIYDGDDDDDQLFIKTGWPVQYKGWFPKGPCIYRLLFTFTQIYL